MYHAIRPGLHYARTGGRILFLDVHRNRYFSLAPAAEPDIERLESGQALNEGSPLIRAGLVVSAETPHAPPESPNVPAESLLDQASRPNAVLVAALLCRFTWATMSLVGAPRRVLANGAAGWDTSGADPVRLRTLAGAYLAATGIAGAHDKCLAWSLALTRLCRRRGDPAICVIGVSARPFSAHSWVQSGDMLVNDRHDHVRNFSPILVL